jgi:acyl carrier protein
MNVEITNIKEKVKAYIYESAHVDKDKIRDESLIFKEGFFDSMGFIVLITYLEEQFGIKTGDSDLLEENFESINAISTFVERKLT